MNNTGQDKQNGKPDPDGPFRPKTPADEEQRLTGIAGWLITYCVFQGLNVLTFLIGLIARQNAPEYTPSDLMLAAEWERVNSISFMLGACSVIGIVICFTLMFRGMRTAKQANILLLTLQSAFAFFALSMMLDLPPELLPAGERGALIVGSFIQVALNVLWILYFRKSRRVALTFTR